MLQLSEPAQITISCNICSNIIITNTNECKWTVLVYRSSGMETLPAPLLSRVYRRTLFSAPYYQYVTFSKCRNDIWWRLEECLEMLLWTMSGQVVLSGKGVQQGGDLWTGCLPVLKKLLEGRSGLKRGSWIRPLSQSETFIHLNQFISKLMEIPGIVLFIGWQFFVLTIVLSFSS